MSTRNGQAVPGTDKELQPALDQATAPHRPERAPRSAISYGNPSPHDLQTGAEIGLAQSPHDSSTIAATYECDPGQYFAKVSVTLVGAPDDGRRRVLVYDLLWGRWSRPPEDGDGDTDNSGRVGSPVPARPPGLTDGATAETDVPAPALTA